MSSRSAGALHVVAVLLLFVLVAGTVAGTGPTGVRDGTSRAGESALVPHNGTLSDTEQVMHVELDPGGDARWHVTIHIPLETRNDTAAFRELATRFEAGRTETFAMDAFRRAARRAGVESDREMRIRNVSRSHRIGNGTGVLVLSFTWTNFARTSGDRLIVGDAFNTTSGTWLPRLNGRQTLLIEPPQGYGVRSSPPVAVENGVARWSGPLEFSSRGPWIVYAGTPGTVTPTTTTVTPTPEPTTTVETTATGTPPGDRDGTSLLGLFALLGGGLVLVVAYLLRRGPGGVPGTGSGPGPGPESPGETATDRSDATGATGEASGTATPDGTQSSEPSEGETTPGTDTAGAGAGTGAEAERAESGAETEDEEVDVELLSDEERVERLLERNGGRMKQASIVKETGWSNAKVSQLLSSMDEDDRIDKLRIGRENLISFPDEDVTDLDSE